MKKMLTFTLLTAVFMSLLSASFLQAQTSDTLKINATKKNGDLQYINEVVSKNPNYKVYQLVTTDTCYYFTNVITISKDIKVIGKPNAITKRPPTISPLELDDKSIPKVLFNLSGNGLKVTLKNIFFLAKSQTNVIANTTNGDPGVMSVSGDNNFVFVDNCFFDSWHHFTFFLTGKNDSFTFTNNVFRNGVMAGNNPWVGEILRNLNRENATGDVVFKNNTMLNIGAYSSCTHTGANINKSFIFDHNTVVYGTKNVLFHFWGTNMKINNNIFYSTFAAGGNKASIDGAWDESDVTAPNAVISFDTLTTATAEAFAPDLKGQADFVKKAEARRIIEVKNNVCFWPQSYTDFLKSYNDTAIAANKRTAPVWMNPRTINMFTDKTMWPGFSQSGNLIVDPGFNQSIKDIATTGKFYDYLKNVFVGGPNSTIVYTYEPNNPTGQINYVPTWPLKEDLSYSNTTLKTGATDGKQIGDLRWYGQFVGVKQTDALPTEFNLEQNYPNPFNPSTKITFSISKNEMVTLKVYNMLGQEVATLVNQRLNAGTFNVDFNASKLTSGVYIYKLEAGSFSVAKKMTLLK